MNVIEIKNLTKLYGNGRGIKNLNLTVEQGDILGLLGPNGSGKTTAMKAILNLVNAEGSVKVFGMDLHDNFEKQLENSTFLRCHQSFIINMERITGAKNDSFRIGDHVIPISRSYNRVAHEKYDEYLRFQQECNGEETE